jgi:hypothetical protein
VVFSTACSEQQLADEEETLARQKKQETTRIRERQQARSRALTAGYAGDFVTMKSLIETHDLDVNAGKEGAEKMLHLAARRGDSMILQFLIETRRKS